VQAQPPAGGAPKGAFKVKGPPFRSLFLKEILPILIIVGCLVYFVIHLRGGGGGGGGGAYTGTLDAINNQIYSKLYDYTWTRNELLDNHEFSRAYQILYEIEELLGNALKEYSAIAERLTPEMSHGYKVYLTRADLYLSVEREEVGIHALYDLIIEAQSSLDPNLLSQVELALVSYKNVISELPPLVDELERLYEQNPEASEKWGRLKPSDIAVYREWITTSESSLEQYSMYYENIKALVSKYTSLKQKNLKASSEIRDRLMALGIVPSDLASFFNQFDEDSNGEISLSEGQEFFYWVEKNVEYRYDDEDSERGIAELCAGWITRAQLGDDRPGSDYWQRPYETFQEGYGDCDDMAILETTFYNYFGVEAYMALVSVERPGIIDHALCIVKIGDNLDEYTKYLGRLNYYELNGKYFMMVDDAYSDKYGYISGGTIGVSVDFTLYEYYTLEQAGAQAHAEWW
jgi:hypothetical protein